MSSSPAPEHREREAASESETPPKAGAPSTPPPKGARATDWSSADLSIEEIEERIAPSETNVFDK